MSDLSRDDQRGACPVTRISCQRPRASVSVSQCPGWSSRSRLHMKRLFQQILLRPHILNSKINFGLGNESKFLRAMISQDLCGIRNGECCLASWKSSRGGGEPPGCSDEGLRPHLPSRVPTVWNPLQDPRVGEETFPAEQAIDSRI